jgi:uncharacterized protein (TIGR02466 family)
MDFQMPDEFGFIEGIDAFPPYIFRAKFNFDFDSFREKTDRYLKESKELSTRENYGDPEEGDAITGVHWNTNDGWDPPHKWEELKKFYEWVEFCTPFIMKQQCDVSGNTFPKFQFAQSWINVHNKGGFTSEHWHQNSTISIAAYLDVPEGSGDLLVLNPLEMVKRAEYLNGNWDASEHRWGRIEVQTGDVLFFPGWLTHKTEPNKVDTPRYVMSVNMSAVRAPREVVKDLPDFSY